MTFMTCNILKVAIDVEVVIIISEILAQKQHVKIFQTTTLKS